MKNKRKRWNLRVDSSLKRMKQGPAPELGEAILPRLPFGVSLKYVGVPGETLSHVSFGRRVTWP